MEDFVRGGNSCCHYIVLWYPTIFHEIFREIDKDKSIEGSSVNKDGFRIKQRFDNYCDKENDIDDGSTEGASLRKKEHDNGDLEYWIKKKGDGSELNFSWKYIESNCTGFAVYSYDSELVGGIKAFYGGEVPDDVIDVIFNLCYHYAKDIYHEHEVQKGSDYRLKPFYKKDGVYLDDIPNIYDFNNDALSCFIEQYENMFVGYARMLSKTYSLFLESFSAFQDLVEMEEEDRKSRWKETLERWRKLKLRYSEYSKLLEKKGTQKERTYEDEIKYVESVAFRKEVISIIEKTEEIIKEKLDVNLPYSEENYRELVAEIKKFISEFSHELNDVCNNALTEYNYCKSLLESVYNTDFNYRMSCENQDNRPQDSNDTKKNRRKEIAFNIRNSLRYIEGVRKKCSMWDSLITHNLTQDVEKLIQENNNLTDSSKKLIEKSKRTDKISLFLGYLSAVLGVFSFILSVRSCESNHAKKCVCERCEIHQTTSTKLCDSATFENDTVRCEKNNIAVESIERKSDFPKEESSSKKVSSNNSRK